MLEDKHSAKLFPKTVASRNLASKASHQLLGERSRRWGCRDHGQGLVHSGGTVKGGCWCCLRPLDGEGGVSVSSPVPLVLNYLLCVFSRDNSMAPPWGTRESRDTQQIPISFLCTVTATSSHCHLLDKVPGFHSHLHKFWISKGYFKRSFS